MRSWVAGTKRRIVKLWSSCAIAGFHHQNLLGRQPDFSEITMNFRSPRLLVTDLVYWAGVLNDSIEVGRSLLAEPFITAGGTVGNRFTGSQNRPRGSLNKNRLDLVARVALDMRYTCVALIHGSLQ